MPGWLPKSSINLGLDLQGGSYLLLEVDMPGVVKERMETMRGDIRAALRRARPTILYTGLDAARESVNLHITDLSELDAARKILRDIRLYQKTAKPFRWKYSDVRNRIPAW